MRKAVSIAGFFALAVTALATMPSLPRKAPELSIKEPSGKEILLSHYRGKVVVVTFMYTTCPHCQHESQMLTKLQKELGPKGLQTLGMAFNDNAAVLVPGFIQQFGVGFPVGYGSPDTVMSYLGFSVMDRYVVPQIAVIDRKGMIRAQSGPQGDPKLQDEGYMRELISSLLKEGAAPGAKNTGTKKKITTAAKKTS
jgi:peroxiredoxin